jgi:hypothetical protein
MVATNSTTSANAPKPASALAIRLGLKFNLSDPHGIKRLFSSKPERRFGIILAIRDTLALTNYPSTNRDLTPI